MKKKSGLSITNGFKSILSEGRKPENLWVDRGSEFYNKTFKSLLKENEIAEAGPGSVKLLRRLKHFLLIVI